MDTLHRELALRYAAEAIEAGGNDLTGLAQVHAMLYMGEAIRAATELAEAMIPAPFRRRRSGG